MADETTCIYQSQQTPIKILKWKVSENTTISIGRVILLYELVGENSGEQRKLKLHQTGTVCRIVAKEGADVAPGEVLCELKACSHPTIMNDMCADCGADLRKDDLAATASVPMVHAIPDLKVSEELAQKLGKADSERLLKDRKLVLLVDLDQTLIHTTNDNIPANIKDVHHFQLYGPQSPWYHTRLRPGTHNFLDNISPYFELHICTFGARNYAHTIAAFLDKEQKYFSNRILSRDECFDPTSKKANLKALFPCGDNMVCIIDDREDVWSHATNLIHVKPYHFFQHTGDINAPPGLDKHENDNKTSIIGNSDDGNDKKKEENYSKQIENGDCIEKISLEKNCDENCEEKNDLASNKKDNDVKNNKDDNKSDKNDKDNKKDEELVEINDSDDYLLHLEDILKRIHREFYENYDRMQSGIVPDLKKVIPQVRKQVLKNCHLVFSGLVPTHIKLEHSKVYQIACSLGAEASQDLDDNTTHLIAIRPGTAKVNAGKRRKNLKIITPDWLWQCAERWEHCNEDVFPLNNKGSKNRHPPPHCTSPEHHYHYCYPEHNTPAMIRKRTPSGRFMDTINPLMSFSSDDIADMDKEVEDILDDDDDDDSDSDNDGYPKGKKRRKTNDLDDDDNEDDDDNKDDDSDSVEAPDDDGEWNMMGAALEREFLSND